MARPIKNNCEYFPHDSDMRSHRKVKAIRKNFPNGYAIWCMLLEFLTSADGNEFENNEIEYELMSGDFEFAAKEISDVVNYCIKLEMLFEKNGFIYSESLNEKLAPVYEKRGKARELSKKQLRQNGKYNGNNAESAEFPTSETPQSKVKEIEVKESKENEGERTSFPNPILPPSEMPYAAFVKPTWEQVSEKMRFASVPNPDDEAKLFVNYYDSVGWSRPNGSPIRQWEPMIPAWIQRGRNSFNGKSRKQTSDDKIREALADPNYYNRPFLQGTGLEK